jgi:hypothetical protein
VNNCRAKNLTSSPSRFVGDDKKGVQGAGDALCEFVDRDNLLNANIGPRRPLVILSFEESDILLDGPRDGDWSLFSEFRRTLGFLNKLPLFSLFLSTAGHFREFSPDIKIDRSLRVRKLEALPLDPITEVSFDCLAPPAEEGKLSLDQVVRMEWISHLGRPL